MWLIKSHVNRLSYQSRPVSLQVWAKSSEGHGVKKHTLHSPLEATSTISLHTKPRFAYFPSAGSQWHLRDDHRYPICLRFRGVLKLLNTVGEPWCTQHWAAHRHEVGGNGIFTVMGTQLQTSFLILGPSLVRGVQWGFYNDKGPVVFSFHTANQSGRLVKSCMRWSSASSGAAATSSPLMMCWCRGARRS